ncbi:MAG: VOC family protein [Actinomycetota bacterium]|nr:VOC family protein [Actinomycetota bacterium]
MPEGPILNQVNLVVSDMEAAVAFYRRLGVAVPDADPAWDDDHRAATMPGGVELDLDSARSVKMWDKGWPADRRGPVVGFSVPTREAVDETYAELIGAGVKGQQPPFDAFWGSRYAVVEDPDGNAVGIMSPQDPERRGPASEL